MAFSTPRTFVVGEVITADMMNTHVRDQLRYLKGLDGTSQIQAGLEVTGSGAYLRPPVLTQAQVGSLTPAAGWIIYNDTKGRHEGYGTAWREIVEPSGTSAQGDVLYASGTGWERLAAGTAGRYLMTQGAGANPTWGTLIPAIITLFGTSEAAVGTAWAQFATGNVPATAKNVYFWVAVESLNGTGGTARIIYDGVVRVTAIDAGQLGFAAGTLAATGTAGTAYAEVMEEVSGKTVRAAAGFIYETVT